MASYEVSTLLSLRDLATAPLQRFIALLREAQGQLDQTMASLKLLQDAQAPGAAMLAAQREMLGLTEREATVRAGIASDMAKQSDAMLAANRESLALARQQLAVQRAMGATGGARFIASANRAGSGLMWGGVGIVGGLAYATQKAIDFNQTALETDLALGGYARSPGRRQADISALQQAAFAGSEATGFFSAQDILVGLKKAASAGARPLVEKMGMGVFTAIAPSLSRYMDVLGRIKGESAEQAATEAIQTAHQFGAYTPTAINRVLNAQAALALLMPDKMSTAVTTGAYVASTGMQLAGMSPEAILALMATADQSGLGRGRAGARLKDYIEAIAVHQSKGREAAKSLLGIRGAIDKDGSLDLMKSFDILIADRKRMSPQAFRDAVREAFGAPGSVVAAMFGDPSKAQMFQANRQVIGQAVGRGDLTTIQNIMKGGAAGQEALAMVRLQNDIVKFGQYGIPIALRFFDTINPRLKAWGEWMDKHPDDAKRLFDGLLDVGAGMLALGGVLKAIAGVAKVVSVVRGVASGLAAISEFTGAVAVTAGIASKFGTLSTYAADLAGPFGIFVAAVGVLADDVKEFQKFKSQGFKLTPYDIIREGLGPLGVLLPRGSSSHAAASSSSSSGAVIHQTHVHIKSVSFVLPKDSDRGLAGRVMQNILGTAGAAHTGSAFMHITPQSYGAAVV